MIVEAHVKGVSTRKVDDIVRLSGSTGDLTLGGFSDLQCAG